MKHPLSGRKHLLTFVLAAAFALGAAVPVLATGGNAHLDLSGLPYQSIDVRVTHDTPEYNVNLAWGSMDFHYKYGTGWDYSGEGTEIKSNEVKIRNSSSVPVAVKLKFDSSMENFTGRFNTKQNGEGINYKALYLSEYEQDTVESEVSASIFLCLDGKPALDMSNRLVGNVVITLTDVLSDDAAQLILDCNGEENIGYVTSDSQLIPYTEKNLNN